MKVGFKMLMASLVGLMLAGAAHAQYPSRQMNMVVAFPAGGPSDVVARVMSKAISEQTNQPVIVENVVGVGGSLGVLKVANATADGHTILAGSPLELIYTPLGVAAAKNKPEDMRMAALMGRTVMVIAVRKDLPVNTMAEFVEYAKKADKPLAFGSTGVGSLYHLMAEDAAKIGGFKALHAPYNGLAPYLKDLMGGVLDWAVLPAAGPVPGAIDGGQIKAIAVVSPAPIARLPKVPSIRETSGYGNYDYSIWIGLQVSKNTPDAIAASLNSAVLAALAKPEVRKSVEAAGVVLAPPMTLGRLDSFYKDEIAAGAAVAKTVGLKPQ
ncbi:tripartite tricarboxylate transporter substrate binding protein [Variovorax sp. PCZ-1]|uniref:tripartite tricarboxylate transporter substrate binding protein n=1 Tax=Variovorax sp. PCZ-1 TaxID=2835533 RepID=UPI001BD10B69|nr:tripartite tricarboxylate transporter substrate binding protein [Variovorax sp. PCZ-1]MBS7809089.1 tripartite tricarboxylate transporter substrate binding protein [Variovorax sp. PCZ-1]